MNFAQKIAVTQGIACENILKIIINRKVFSDLARRGSQKEKWICAADEVSFLISSLVKQDLITGSNKEKMTTRKISNTIYPETNLEQFILNKSSLELFTTQNEKTIEVKEGNLRDGNERECESANSKEETRAVKEEILETEIETETGSEEVPLVSEERNVIVSWLTFRPVADRESAEPGEDSRETADSCSSATQIYYSHDPSAYIKSHKPLEILTRVPATEENRSGSEESSSQAKPLMKGNSPQFKNLPDLSRRESVDRFQFHSAASENESGRRPSDILFAAMLPDPEFTPSFLNIHENLIEEDFNHQNLEANIEKSSSVVQQDDKTGQ